MSLILDFLFPKTCYGCGQNLGYLCPDCQAKLSTLALSPNRLSLFKYRSPLKDILQDLKYQHLTDLIPVLTQICVANIKQSFPHLLSYWQENDYVLVPIPLHWYRQNWRGFNQSELLGLSLARSLDLKYQTILSRKKYARPQVKTTSKIARKTNIGNAFALRNSPLGGERGPSGTGVLVPPNVILFDDVYTTGSTLNSAAAALPKNSSLWFLTLAG